MVAPSSALRAAVRRRWRGAGCATLRGRVVCGRDGCAAVLVSCQVGFFSARYAPHLLGRNLAPLPPLLFLLFAAWLARGAPRPRVTGAATAVLLRSRSSSCAPWNNLIVERPCPTRSVSSSSSSGPTGAPADTVAIGAAACLLIVVAAPSAHGSFCRCWCFALLVDVGRLASNRSPSGRACDQSVLVGVPPAGSTSAATVPVAYLLRRRSGLERSSGRSGSGTTVTDVSHARAVGVPGPMTQRVVHVPPTGRLPIAERLHRRERPDAFVGTPSRTRVDRPRQLRPDAVAPPTGPGAIDHHAERQAERRHDRARRRDRLTTAQGGRPGI